MHFSILDEGQALKMNHKQAYLYEKSYLLECLHKHKIIIHIDKLVIESLKEYYPLQSVSIPTCYRLNLFMS